MDLWYACHGSMQKEEVASLFAIRSKNEENFLFPTIRRPPHAPAGTGLQPCNAPGTALHEPPPSPVRPCASGSNAACGDEQAKRGGEGLPDSYVLWRVTLTQKKKSR